MIKSNDVLLTLPSDTLVFKQVMHYNQVPTIWRRHIQVPDWASVVMYVYVITLKIKS